MTKLPSLRLFVAAALGLFPALALTWTPYDCGPFSNLGSGTALPAGSTYPNMPYRGMPEYGNPYAGAAGGFPAMPYGYGLGMPGQVFAPIYNPLGHVQRFGAMNKASGFFVTQRATGDAYVLDIALNNMQPAQLQVDIRGPWIRISAKDTREDMREEQFGDGRGFMRSYSYSSGSNVQRIALPRDANPAGMRRENTADSVHIFIPRMTR